MLVHGRWPERLMFTGARNFAMRIRTWRNGGKPAGEFGVDVSGSRGFAEQIVPGEQPLSRR
jgi:hypothetical protein